MSDRVRLLMGPWYHVTNFDGLHINALQLRWFDQWLQDDASAAISDPPFTFQAIGCRQWFHAREFPLAEASPPAFTCASQAASAVTARRTKRWRPSITLRAVRWQGEAWSSGPSG
ncbi:putative peptidase S15 domain protein [Mycobacterium xenopi 4042]|uniref:Putative peptidase S15 domain protein n=1 Tax=Mycobacterium xenopi 4042 TaxID=1299334 RepID=X8DIW0_MYCXE|nr:putative peptidase S15 domain protein [Mycobacterium xenopi 4042]